MSATLDYGIKPVFHHLAHDSRWNVLSVLILHANIRNRCWPKVDTLAAMATNGNRKIAIRAKNWLIEHKAIELVPHDKRVDKEVGLHQSRHVYQLTGNIEIADNDGELKAYSYLHHFNSVAPTLLNGNSVAGKSVPDKSVPGTPHKYYQEKQTKTKKKTTTKQQQAGVGGLCLCLAESVLKVFRGNDKLPRQLIKEYGEDLVNGWCQYAIANTDSVKSPIGFVRAKLQAGDTPPAPAPTPAANPTPIIIDDPPPPPFNSDWEKYQQAYVREVDNTTLSQWNNAKSQAAFGQNAAIITNTFRRWRLLNIEPDGTFVVFVPNIKSAQAYTRMLAAALTSIRNAPTTIRLVDKRPMSYLKFCKFGSGGIVPPEYIAPNTTGATQ